MDHELGGVGRFCKAKEDVQRWGQEVVNEVGDTPSDILKDWKTRCESESVASQMVAAEALWGILGELVEIKDLLRAIVVAKPQGGE